MISIKKLGSAGAASSYYEKADYYTKGQDDKDISSEYYGSLAGEFGLEGAIDRKEFKSLLEGDMPNGQRLGTDRNGKREHTAGWDLTFSAPKSVSILALVGDDKKLIDAHNSSVNAALDFVEKEVIKGRVNNSFYKGEIDLEKALIAKFTHTTSRKLDPQLHTHSVILNAAMAKDGDIRSIDSRHIYDSSMLIGQIYRNELASNLKKMGYTVDWDAKTGLFEVAGVDKNLIENFSKRRTEIKELAAELGIEGAKGMDAVTVSSRDKKEQIGRNELTEGWDSEAKSLGIDPEKIVKNAKEKGKDHEKASWGTYIREKFNPKTSLDQTVRDSITQLSHYESAFSRNDVLQQALRFSGDKYSYSDINRTLKYYEKSGDVISSKNVKGMLTTPEVVRQERYILKVEKDNRGRFAPIMSDKQIDKKIEDLEKNGTVFTGGQKDSFTHLLKSQDMVNGVQGHAGVGKSFMLKPLVDIAKEKGIEVKVAAPFGEIATKLGKDLDVESNTLKSLIFELEREVKKGKEGDKGDRIIIVDEASTINSPDMASLMTNASLLGNRVILSGDRAQLGGVERGKSYAQLIENGMGTTVNTDIVRQKEGTLARNVVDETYNRKFEKALEALGDKVLEEGNRDKRLNSFVSDYIKLKEHDPSHLGLIMDNKTRKEANTLIREEYKRKGIIDKNEIKIEALVSAKNDAVSKKMAQSYKEGMTVRFLQDYKKLGVRKDSYFNVVSSNSREVILSDGKRQFKWNPSEIAGNKINGGVTSYIKEDLNLSKGDEIRFKDKNIELDVKNGRMAKVVDIKDGKVVVKGEDGKIRTIDPKNNRHKHIEHSYISTAYTSQGLTGNSVQAIADSNQKSLLNDSSFLVAVSRAKHDIRLYVDSKDRVSKALSSRSGMKKSGLDITDSQNQKPVPEAKMRETMVTETKQHLDFNMEKSSGKTKTEKEKVFLP